MSTRAMYTFKDQDECRHVYKHYDGYPSGAIGFIQAAAALAWPLPRYEPDEFAAAFVAANKTSPGSVRLMPSGKVKDVAPGDIAYRYEISPGNGAELRVSAYAVDNWKKYKETLLFSCNFADLDAALAKFEAEQEEA